MGLSFRMCERGVTGLVVICEDQDSDALSVSQAICTVVGGLVLNGPKCPQQCAWPQACPQ